MIAATAPARVSVSDNAQQRILRKTQRQPFPLTFPLSDLLVCEFSQNQYREHFTTRSIFVTKVDGSPTEQWTEVEFRPSMARALRFVVARKVRPFWPYKETHPEYVLVACTEELECGHEIEVFPQVDSLTAKRRECSQCSGRIGSLPLNSKKSVQSVRPKEAA